MEEDNQSTDGRHKKTGNDVTSSRNQAVVVAS